MLLETKRVCHWMAENKTRYFLMGNKLPNIFFLFIEHHEQTYHEDVASPFIIKNKQTARMENKYKKRSRTQQDSSSSPFFFTSLVTPTPKRITPFFTLFFPPPILNGRMPKGSFSSIETLQWGPLFLFVFTGPRQKFLCSLLSFLFFTSLFLFSLQSAEPCSLFLIPKTVNPFFIFLLLFYSTR